jgi:hypothetical protein
MSLEGSVNAGSLLGSVFTQLRCSPFKAPSSSAVPWYGPLVWAFGMGLWYGPLVWPQVLWSSLERCPYQGAPGSGA